MAARWVERRFERLIWKFRLISIVPVVLSLLESVGCFVIGAIEVINAFLKHTLQAVGYVEALRPGTRAYETLRQRRQTQGEKEGSILARANNESFKC